MSKVLVRIFLLTLVFSQISYAVEDTSPKSDASKPSEVQAESGASKEQAASQTSSASEDSKEGSTQSLNVEPPAEDIRKLDYQNRKGHFSIGYLKTENYASMIMSSGSQFVDATATDTKNYFGVKYGIIENLSISIAMGTGAGDYNYHISSILPPPTSTRIKLSSSGELDKVYSLQFRPMKNEHGSLNLIVSYIPASMSRLTPESGKNGNVAAVGNYTKYEAQMSKLIWDSHNFSLAYSMSNTASGKSNNATKTAPKKYDSESESILTLRYRYLISTWAFVDILTKRVNSSVTKTTDLNTGVSSSMAAYSRNLTGLNFGLAFGNSIKISGETLLNDLDGELRVTSSDGSTDKVDLGFESLSTISAEVIF